MPGGHEVRFVDHGAGLTTDNGTGPKRLRRRHQIQAAGFLFDPVDVSIPKQTVREEEKQIGRPSWSAATQSAWELSVSRAFRGYFRSASASQWARENFELPPTASSAPGPFQPTSYQASMMDLICMEGGPRKIVFLKSARIGYTSVLAASIAHNAHAQRNQVVYMPNEELAKRWSKSTLLPSLELCPPINEMLYEGEDKRRKSISFIGVGGKVIYVLGAVSANNFREFEAQGVFLDECDGMPASVGRGQAGPGAAGRNGEGDPVYLASRALRNAVGYKRLVLGSTPTDPNTSIVWKEWNESQIRFVYHVECPLCERLTPLYYRNFIWARRRPSIEEAAATIKYVCPSCSKKWGNSMLGKSLENGKWIVPHLRADTIYEDDGQEEIAQTEDKFAGWRIETGAGAPVLLDADGRKKPWPVSIGLYCWAAYSPLCPWEEWLVDWLKAQGDEEAKKTWTNHVRGLPWADRMNEVNESDLLGNQFRSQPALPMKIRWLCGALDVQAGKGKTGKKGFLSLLVVGWDVNTVAYVIEQRVFEGDVSTADGVGWESLREWLYTKPTWKREDGLELPLGAFGMDEGWNTEVCREVFPSLQTNCNKYLLRGNGAPKAPLFKLRSDPVENRMGENMVVHQVGTLRAKSGMLERMKSGKVKVSDALTRQTLIELSSERRQFRYSGGNWKTVWNRVGVRATEAWDCLCYSFFMFSSYNPRLDLINKPKAKEDVKPPEELEELEKPATAEEPEPVVVRETPGVRMIRNANRTRAGAFRV